MPGSSISNLKGAVALSLSLFSLSLEITQGVALRAGPVEKHIEVFGLGQGLLAAGDVTFLNQVRST